MSFPVSEMHETASVRPTAGQGAYGPVYGTAFGINCYLEPGFRRVTNERGEEVVASLFGVFPATSSLSAGDELTWNDRRYIAVDVQPMSFGGSPDHVEAYFTSEGESD
jgi:hypothetical protein